MSKLEELIDKLQGRVKFHRKEMKTEMINDIIAQRLGAVAELKWIIRELKKQTSSHREEIEKAYAAGFYGRVERRGEYKSASDYYEKTFGK